MNKHIRPWYRLLALAIASIVFAAFAPTIVQAVDPPTVQSLSETTTKLQIPIDTIWVLITGFLVFFMQTGFAMLEAGLIRQRGVVNVLLENFINAAVTILVWWGIDFGIAFGTSAGGLVGIDNFFLSQLPGADGSYTLGAPGSTAAINTYTLFFFQFAFAATASTIITGSMAGRTDFIGDLIYSGIMGAISYPIIVHWVWNSGGWLAGLVAITAPCAYVLPWASVLIGLTGGILVTLGVDLIESLHIDDPVGAFAVHGINGMMSTLSVGFLVYAIEQFIEEEDKNRTQTPGIGALDSE